MNESGQATGWSYAPSPANFFAFLYTLGNGTMANLGELLGANNSTGYDINDAGQVTATSAWYLGGSWSRGAIADLPGGMHDIGTLGGARCFPQAINELGHVTGSSDTGVMNSATEYRLRAFVWRDGVMTDLGALPGLPLSVGRGLNSTGSVVGLCRETSSSGSLVRAFVWRDGTMTDLNTRIDPSGGWTIEDAVDITDDGRILCAGVLGGARRAVVLIPN
jgi:probable HAF family extracellular repeat protein